MQEVQADDLAWGQTKSIAEQRTSVVTKCYSRVSPKQNGARKNAEIVKSFPDIRHVLVLLEAIAS